MLIFFSPTAKTVLSKLPDEAYDKAYNCYQNGN
jgi:hypothetical protein